MFKFVIVTLATLAVVSAKPGIISPFAAQFATGPVPTPFAAPVTTPFSGPVATPFAAPVATTFAAPVTTPFDAPVATPFTTPVATPFAPAPIAEAHFGYTAPQAPLAYSSFYGNSASQVDLRQNYNSFPASAPAPFPFSVSPLSYSSPVARFAASPIAAASIHPFAASLRYGAPAGPYAF